MSSDTYVLIEHIQGNINDITYMMIAAANEISQAAGGEVVAVLLGKDASGHAAHVKADRVLYIEHPALAEFSPEAYRIAIANLLTTDQPRVFLMGETSIGADVAGMLSAQAGIPHISMCKSIRSEGEELTFVSQICGGKIMAEGQIPAPTCFVTMIPGEYKVEAGQTDTAPALDKIEAPALDDLRVTHKAYVEPELGDVDISKETVLIAVGRGIQQEMNLEYAEELADQINAVICASRPVVDQGWLGASRLVGKSGKRVNPKIYISMGISGAPEHAEGIGDADLFIAINTDPQAPIFDIADYGAAADLFELVPALTEKIKAVKGG